MTMTLDQFIVKNMNKIGIRGWFALYPEVQREVDRHLLAGTSPSLIYDWMSIEKGFPLGRTSLVRYGQTLRDTQARKQAA